VLKTAAPCMIKCTPYGLWLQAVPEPSSHARRDELLDMQSRAQQKWAQHKAFEVDAPAEGKGFHSHVCICIFRPFAVVMRCSWDRSTSHALHDFSNDPVTCAHYKADLCRSPVRTSGFAALHRKRDGVREVLWDFPVPLHEWLAAPWTCLLAIQGALRTARHAGHAGSL
jgi:hypothetical protein